MHPLLALLICLAPADEPLKADVAAGKALLAEGDAAADKGDPTEAVLKYKSAFEQLLPGMRKLPFKAVVKRDVTAREAMGEVLKKELDADATPEEFRGEELGMKALGLIPKDLNYKDILIKVYSEEIAAFYDPKTDTMHLIREPEAKLKKKPGFFESLLGKKAGFDKDENKTVIAHELTHALADQNYDLDKMQAAAKGDDDRELALSSLIEGEATLTMLGAQMSDWSGDQIGKMRSEDLDRTFRLLGPLMVGIGGGESLKKAPPILAESLTFPYLRGVVFAARLTNDGDWAAIDAAYKNPPLSTEQIMHPRKYKLEPDAPIAVDLGELKVDGWKEACRNVVGEFQTSVLLSKYDGRAAAAGWGGDAFAAFEGPAGKLGLVWATSWDTEADAKEYAASAAKFQTTKLGEGTQIPAEYPDVITRTAGDATFSVVRRGKDVAVVEGFDGATTSRFVESAFAGKRSEKVAGKGR